jgi:hypothetical protein
MPHRSNEFTENKRIALGDLRVNILKQYNCFKTIFCLLPAKLTEAVLSFQDEFDDFDDFEEEQPQTVSRGNIILWLVVIGLIILFIPLNLVSTTIQSDVTRLESDVIPLEEQVATNLTPPADVQALIDQAAVIEGDVSQIEAIYPTLVASHVDWPLALNAIANYDRTQMRLTELTQSGKRLIISGQAFNNSIVVSYAQALQASGQFAEVEIQSIALLDGPIFTPTPTLTSSEIITLTLTPTTTSSTGGGAGGGSGGGSGGSGASGGGSGSGSGTGALPTATTPPDPRDEFEPDANQSPPIYLGQIQERNFYPNGDVDTAVFLAKAGQYYQIITENLAPGVDTVLEVTVGETAYTNDDGKSGSLGSLVTFQTGGSDVQVKIRITNRGVYGKEMNYQLLVEATAPTPTGTPMPTFTPQPTATSGPTNTPAPPTETPTPTFTPQPTPTFTPIPGDIYEPNNTSPSFIGVGETQTHTFDPDSDIDSVTFPVKDGRQYQILSDNLGFGVDTFLEVDIDDEHFENDDYAPPGSGNLASGVCFRASSLVSPIATFSNLTNQFGGDKSYDIVVNEVPALDIDAEQLDFGPVQSGDPNPSPMTLSLTSAEIITWTAQPEAGWVNVAPITSTTPSLADISVDITGLAAGMYESRVVFSWLDFCQETVTVTLQIDPVSGLNDLNGVAELITKAPLAAKMANLPPYQTEVSFIIVVDLVADLPEKP